MSEEQDRADLAELEQGRMQAMQDRDEARLEELVAPGFRFTALHLAPEPMSREQWMGAALGGYHIISFAYESMDIDVFGDTAVIHARYSQIANFDAVNLSHGYRLTDIWARRDGRWQVVAPPPASLSDRASLALPRAGRDDVRAAMSCSRRSRARSCGRAGRPRPFG